MENLILKCKTKYDLDVITNFNRFHMYSKLSTKIVTVISVLLFILAIFAPDFDITFRTLIGAIAIIWILEVVFLPKVYAKKAYTSSKITSNSLIEAEFYEEKIILKTIKDNEIVGNSTLKYDDLFKIVDDKKYMYLYISQNQAFICNKNNFEGDYNKLLEVLKEKLGKKYKVKK